MRNMGFILDVGCGNKPQGDVNVDLFSSVTPHLRKDRNAINSHDIPNFVNADIHFLPFRRSTFSLVTCFSVLEHKGVSFSKAVRELYRVAIREVIIRVPHRYQRDSWLRWKQFGMHDKIFNISMLDEWLKSNGFKFYRLNTIYKEFPSLFLPLIRLPWEIEMRLMKHEKN